MNKALFLDRDGVINVDHGYVFKSEDIQFVDGIFELVERCRKAGYLIVVVTNQSGIARGLYTEQEFHTLTNWMRAQFQLKGSDLDAVYFCPHHPTKGQSPYRQQCLCRKPQPGMILQAAEDHNIDVNKSVLIGDKLSDMQAAAAAGIRKAIFLSGGYPTQPGEILPDICQVIDKLADVTV